MLPHRPLRSISASDWRTLLTVLPVTVAIRIGLMVIPFRALVRLLRKSAEHVRSPLSTDERYLRRLAWAVNAVGSRILGNRPCLTQALTLQFLLWCRGTDTELRIGVEKNEIGELLAHAWVLYEGRILVGGSLSEEKFEVLQQLQDKL